MSSKLVPYENTAEHEAPLEELTPEERHEEAQYGLLKRADAASTKDRFQELWKQVDATFQKEYVDVISNLYRQEALIGQPGSWIRSASRDELIALGCEIEEDEELRRPDEQRWSVSVKVEYPSGLVDEAHFQRHNKQSLIAQLIRWAGTIED